ncbi:putative ABC multidrug efflux transporter [Synechococcus sp. A18-46.1]|nr:putative ABC multidrug efflux transporter [Synechococcus sp. A18-46.1]
MLNASKAGFRRLLPLLRPHLRQLMTGGLCMVVYVGSFPVLVSLAGELFPALGSKDLSRVLQLIAQAVLIFAVQKLAQFGQDSLLAEPALLVSQRLRRELFSTLQRVELGALEKLSAGDLTYRLTEDADRVSEVLYKTIHDTVPSVLQLLVVLGTMLWLDWKLTIAILLLAPVIVWLISLFGAQVMRATERSQKKVSELAGLLGEAIEGLPLVRAFAAEPWLQDRFEQEISQHRQARQRTYLLVALQHPVVGIIEVIGLFAVLGLAAWRIESGDLTIPGLSSYLTGLIVLIDPIAHVTNNFNEFQQGQASLRRLREIEQEPLEPSDPADSVSLGDVKGALSLESLSFHYVKGQTVLDRLDLQVPAGSVLAVVGPSGAGKSTLFSLLLRFNTAQQGSILLDGVDISSMRSRELRQRVALVPQRTTVFSGSIAEAIRFGRRATHEQMVSAARLANADDFIQALPDGYNTKLEERGSNLSGGQLQRIAIARAVLGDPAILLLDEATSALDAEAEAAVQLGLNRAMTDRTVIVIAHRLATVQEADKIVVLEHGRIVELGSHAELMNAYGRYRDLCERQIIRGVEVT